MAPLGQFHIVGTVQHTGTTGAAPKLETALIESGAEVPAVGPVDTQVGVDVRFVGEQTLIMLLLLSLTYRRGNRNSERLDSPKVTPAVSDRAEM